MKSVLVNLKSERLSTKNLSGIGNDYACERKCCSEKSKGWQAKLDTVDSEAKKVAALK